MLFSGMMVLYLFHIPWLRSEACRDDKISKAKLFITDDGLNHSSAKLFKSRTTIIALVGATIGKTGFLLFESATNQNIAGLYPRDENELLPEFLFVCTKSLYGKFIGIGSGKFKMANLSFVKSLRIPLPPLTEQKKIVARLDALSAKLKKIEEYQQSTQVDLDRLEQSILHQAFSGNSYTERVMSEKEMDMI